MKNKTKHQKPIDSDIHFKYICPNNKCSDTHWLSLKQTQTKNFKVVCDCGKVFSVKRIKTIKVKYYNSKILPTKQINDTPENLEFIDKTVSALLGFGFSKTDAVRMVADEYHRTATTNPALLIKNILDSLGGKNG